MIEALLGNESCEKALVFITARGEGYMTEIAELFDSNVSQIKKQLEKLEIAGILVGRYIGRTRMFSFNPRNPFRKEIEALMNKVIEHYPKKLQKQLRENRRRPRRGGKSL
jgi:hypothetical protein